MNITITINDDKEIKVEQVNGSQNELVSKNILSTKPITIGKPILIYEYELANLLLSKGFKMKNIAFSKKEGEEGNFVFFFYRVKEIKEICYLWNKEKNKVFEKQGQESDLQSLQTDTIEVQE